MSCPAPSQRPWLTELRRRFSTLPWLKGTGNTVFLVIFFYLYLAIQRHPLFEVTQIPATALDRWIGFQPWALGLYLSLWVYTALPAALQPDVRGLVRYGLHVGVMCTLGLLIFIFWPTSVSAAVGPRDGGGMFATLYAVDTNGNACPSLHVAAAIFSFMWLRAMLRTIGVPPALHALNALWCLGICYSTLAVKQHLLLDVIAGAVLGAVMALWSLRAAAREHPAVQ